LFTTHIDALNERNEHYLKPRTERAVHRYFLLGQETLRVELWSFEGVQPQRMPFGTLFMTRSFLRVALYFAISAFILLVADSCQASGSSHTTVTSVRSDSSNMYLIAINAAVDFPGQLDRPRATPGIVESNGMYSIDIQMESTEELLPAGTTPMPLPIAEVLAIYAELTGAELQVDEAVRNFPGQLRFGQYPEMTRTQACDFVERMLRDQAGVELVQVNGPRAVVRFAKQPDQWSFWLLSFSSLNFPHLLSRRPSESNFWKLLQAQGCQRCRTHVCGKSGCIALALLRLQGWHPLGWPGKECSDGATVAGLGADSSGSCKNEFSTSVNFGMAHIRSGYQSTR
jgi:hypothetical protein